MPGIYDGDAHIPLLSMGLRHQEVHSPRAGGITHVNTALQWQQLKDFNVTVVGEFCASTSLPRYIPTLSVEPENTDGFAAWLDEHADELHPHWARVCKLYSPDPNFEANVNAVWRAGLTAVIYSWDDDDLDRVAALRGGPIHHRHARSKATTEIMRSTPNATIQTSPHYLVELVEKHAKNLHVLPPVPGGGDRTSLLSVLESEIDMIATDDNAPVHGNTGPGLSSQRYMLSALLTVAEHEGLSLQTLWNKVTSAPAEIFGTRDLVGDSLIVVDPKHRKQVGSETGEAIRNPYAGLVLSGAVVAMTCDGQGVVL
ncbi:amidohydrolase family protein [Gordonia metallireducens]|uniref:hypothetical protein n=1 Tax=Gordonia metallireducens TaxID=2897779 RepID=UPI001E5DEE81|nr:hypothetical protein [Gordonia metallireducens]